MSSYFLIYFHSEFICSLGSDYYSEYKVTNILAQHLLSIFWVAMPGVPSFRFRQHARPI